ncbi:hypothetical protein A9Q94_04965 [Rhodobacterales bacterium 56_14_T64]|nr:hypothetical protein A9Q94_04965 [Rhodobacterales bacterium 56_14_T64]
MKKIHINEPELCCLGLFRVALSEDTHEARMRAIDVMRHEVVSLGLSNFPFGAGKTKGKAKNDKFVRWVAETSVERYEAAHEYSEISKRYDGKNERKLNVAEYVGKLIWHSIQEQDFTGLYVAGGILERVRKIARDEGIHGARDKDVVSKTWVTYRGVVHLGMAIDYCEENPNQGLNVLQVAERIRRGLSQNCPKKTSKPYVSSDDQISFCYISAV